MKPRPEFRGHNSYILFAFRPGFFGIKSRPSSLDKRCTNLSSPSGRPVRSCRKKRPSSPSLRAVMNAFQSSTRASNGSTLNSFFPAPVGYQIKIRLVICVPEKHRLSTVPPLGDVMRDSRDDHSCQPCHGRSLPPIGIVSPDFVPDFVLCPQISGVSPCS